MASDIPNSEVTKAIIYAANAHATQDRWDGTPYILHPLRVMAHMSTNYERVIAVLHDVLEDTDSTVDGLLREGFTSELVWMVTLLSRVPNQTNDEYLAVIEQEEVATKVKIQDLLDNLNVHSLPPSDTGTLTDKDVLRMNRYIDALRRLGYYG